MFMAKIASKADTPDPAFFISEDEWEYWQERAAIMEYDGGLSRDEAELKAYKYLLLRRNRYAQTA